MQEVKQNWKIIYYTAPSGDIPVRQFLNAAGPTIKTKTLRILFHIEEYGLQAAISHIKKLTGTPLWEIRILGRDSVRIIFVTQVKKQILLLHAFYKKTKTTPPRELAHAMKRLREVERS